MEGKINFLGTNPPEQMAVPEESSLTEETTQEQPQQPTAEQPVSEPVAEPQVETAQEPVVETTPEFNWQEEASKSGWGNEDTFREKFENEYKEKYSYKSENALINRLIEMEKNGTSPTREMILAVTENFDSYDTNNVSTAMELVKRNKARQNPTLTAEQVNFLVEKEYELLSQSLDEDDVDYDAKLKAQKDTQMTLSIAASQAKAELKAYSESLAIPEGGTPQKTQEQILAEQQQAKQAREKSLNLVKTAVDVYEGESFKISENETFKWAATEESKAELNDVMQKTVDDWTAFVPKAENGEIDVKELSRMVYLYKNFDEISKGIIAQTTATARKEFIDNDLKNYSKTTTGSPSQNATRTDGYANEKQAAFAKAFGGR